MKISTLFLLILLPFLSISQSLKKVEKIISGNSQEVFYVLSSNDTIKSGKYTLYKNFKPKISGYYLDNKRNGKWVYYHHNKTKRAEGRYESGKRIGVWKFYNNKKQLIQTYNFEKQLLTNEGPLKNEEITCKAGSKYEGLLFLDRRAGFKGGNAKLTEFIYEKLDLNLVKKAKVSGKIRIGFTINPDGELINVKVIEGINDVLDNEAMRVVKLTSDKWNPARFEDENFLEAMVLPINIIN